MDFDNVDNRSCWTVTFWALGVAAILGLGATALSAAPADLSAKSAAPLVRAAALSK